MQHSVDGPREVAASVEQIQRSLRWLGIDWDEGPIYQSANAERHAEDRSQNRDPPRQEGDDAEDEGHDA